ncbi:MAG: LysR family transcriptional regulator [Chlamydiota bacterium]
MDLIFLRYFYDAVRLGGVTESSRVNCVTQSTISQGISHLENALGVSLLTHQRNAMKVTLEGEIVYRWGHGIFRQVDELKSQLLDRDVYSGQVAIACSHSLGLSILPQLLESYRKVAPEVKPRVLFGHTEMIKMWLKQGDVELGIVMDNDDLTSFDLQWIYSGSFRFFQSGARDPDCQIVQSIFSPARTEVHAVKRLFVELFGYEVATELEICSWVMIAKMVGITKSVGFIPDYLAFCSDRGTQIQPCDIDLAIPYSLSVASLSGERLSRNAKLFLEISASIFKEKNILKGIEWSAIHSR